MEMPGHLWQVLGLGTITVEVLFHPPLDIAAAAAEAGLHWAEGGDRPSVAAARKALAERCRTVIARGVSAALAGEAAANQLAAEESEPTVHILDEKQAPVHRYSSAATVVDGQLSYRA